jgi:TldD protein
VLHRSTIRKLVPILRRDLKRTLKLHMPGFPKVYYSAFLLRDIEWFNTWAGSGSVHRRRSDHTRNVYCDIRVGSYRYDQVMDGGLLDNDIETESYGHISVPIDQRNYDGLRTVLWRLADAKYREAIADYQKRRSNGISTVDQNRAYSSFTKLKRHRYVTFARPEYVDEEYWVKFCKNASRWIAELPATTSGSVEFDATQMTKILVNSEGSVIVQHSHVFSLIASLRKMTKDGSQIEQELVFNCASQDELPSMQRFKELVTEKYRQLREVSRAKRIHSFSGPVLLCPEPAGLLLHEAIGHRLEGSRFLSTIEGQTFKEQVGKKVLNVNLTIRDNPLVRTFQGVRCIGSYRYDDEGTPGKNSLLIDDGVVRDFLNTRAAITKKNFVPNGHARTHKHQRPISRMAVTIIEGEHGLSHNELKARLIEEIKAQNKPFGMIIYETSGGETETTAYNFQAFSGEISYAKLVYPNGKEVVVRGVDFVGTPMQALNNVIATGNELVVNNGYCGAESGFLPITTISPAVLLSNLELQSKSEELVTPFILKKPRLSRRKKK